MAFDCRMTPLGIVLAPAQSHQIRSVLPAQLYHPLAVLEQ